MSDPSRGRPEPLHGLLTTERAIDYLLASAEYQNGVLADLKTHMGGLMASEAELQSNLDQINQILTGDDGVLPVLTSGLADMRQRIADLQAQVAAGSSVSQADLDAFANQTSEIVTKATGHLQKLQALADSTAPEPPAPAPNP